MVKFNFTTRNKIICFTLIFFLVFNMSTPMSIVFAKTTLSKEESKSLEYALFASDNLTLNNFSTIVNGNIYTGDDLNYTGENPVTINGYGNFNGKYDETKINSLKEIKDDKEKIVDFEDEVISKLKNTENYDEDTVFSQDIIDVSKDINVDGNLHIDRSTLNGTGYILAKHNIIYDAINDKVNDYNAFMYSENGNITISGSNIVINGVIAAPKGKIIINAKNIEINGSIYGESIEINGSNLIVNDNSSSITKNFFDPNLDILTEGELKENRKVTLDISENKDMSLVEEDSISWSILPFNIEDGELYNEMYQGIKIDEDTSNDNVKNLIFKKAGKYLVKINYSTKKKNSSIEKIIEIKEDEAPIADFSVDSTYFRDGESREANITIKDLSYSKDNDAISNRIWKIKYDSNNDGNYDDEEEIVLNDNNETEINYKTDKVGKYKVQLEVNESFTNTIEKFISDEDFRNNKKENSFVVDNNKPESAVEVEKSKKVDLVFTVGKADSEKINTYSEKIEEIKNSLEDKGFETNVSTVTTSKLTAQDTFAWQEYDHYNYSDYYLPTLPKHIIYEENDIKMLGYSRAPLKDFLYVPDNNKTQKIFNFDMQRDGTDWHSMEGGGFLFNSSISENKLNGFCILLTQSGLKLVQINNVNLDSFRNGSYNYVEQAGKQLRTFSMSNLYDNHHIKIVVDSDTISLWDGDKLLIDNYVLPEGDYGNGFGPIISHGSHSCWQQSYFTFKNITMETVTGKSLAEVLDGNNWSKGASRYVINLSDEEVQDIKSDKDTGDVARAILNEEINFAALGNNNNKERYENLINTSGGIYFDGTNIEDAMDALGNYILSNELSKDYAVDRYITTDDEVDYIDSFKDSENDPLYEADWQYDYNPTVFTSNFNENSIETTSRKEPIRIFDKTGAYSIKLKVQDNPGLNNDFLAEYRKWSDNSIYQKVLMVHNRPIIESSVDLYESTDDKTKCIVKFTENSFDVDHEEDLDKGILSKEYSYKEINDSTWQNGVIPNKLDVGKIYLFKEIVKDKEGFYSKPKIIVVDTNSFKQQEEVTDNELPNIYINTSKDSGEVSDNIEISGYAIDNMGVDKFELYVNGEKVLDKPGRIFYNCYKEETISIVAKAVDLYGNESQSTKEINVTDNRDKTPPSVDIELPAIGTELNEKTKIIGTVKDDVKLKEYVLSYRAKGSEDYINISKGNEPVINSEIGTFDPTYLKNGIYEIKLYAEDTAGNKAYLTGEYVVNLDKEIESPNKEKEVKPTVDINIDIDKVKVNETLSFDVSAEDNRGIDKVEVYKNDELIGSEQGIYTISDSESGIKKIKVIVTDIDGNETIKEIEYTVIDDKDNIAPTVTIDTPEHGKTISGSTSIIGTAKDDKELVRYILQYRKTGDTNFITFAEVDKSKENEILGVFNTSLLANGIYEVRLTAEDKGGNTSYTQYSYNILNKSVDENIGPKINLVLTSNYASINKMVKAGISVTDTDLKEYKVYMDGTEVKDKNGIFEFTSDIAKTVEIKVYAIDNKGNKSEKKATCAFYNDLDKESPTAKLITPDDYEVIYSPTSIIGSAFDESEMDKYILDYKLDKDNGYTTIVEGAKEKRNEELGIFDTTMLNNGIYEVRLRVIDKGGNVTTTKRTYTVEGKMKIGNMALGFQDIKSNMNGISISVNRQYDNRNKQKGDFGIGWNLGLQDIKVYESYPLGEGYEQHKEGSFLFSKYVVSETVPHFVVISYGDGTSDRFKVKLSKTTNPYIPLYETYIEFESVTNPDVKLQIDGDNAIELFGRTGEVQNIFEYDPQNFILTQSDGTKLFINKNTGLKSIKEENGNEIKVSRNGYTSTNGKSITFKRDSEDRIIKAIDINGDVTSYSYNSNGDLEEVTNPMNNAVTFKYDNNHNIVEIIDPTGSSISRNEYDENGRLIATIDGEGNRIEFDHNIDENTDIVKDKNGNISTYIYDDYGNLLKQVDPLGNVIENKFDENNNLILTIDQLGNNKTYGYDENNKLSRITDALGNVSETSYSNKGQLTKIENMGKIDFIVDYDKKGNINKTEDAMGNETNYEYDSKGKLTGVTDDIGKFINMTYDKDGNVTSTTDGEGNATAYTFDEKGNCLSKTIVREGYNSSESITYSYVYDLAGNIIQAIDGEGNVTKNEYDGNGNIIASVDGKNRRTTFEYNSLGDVTTINYCDNTKETFVYDGNGNTISATNRNGQIIKWTYDKNNNMTSIIYQNGSTQKYTYDKKGRVETITSVSGGITTYEYDEIDRNTAIIDALGNKNLFTYDKYSNIASMEDEKGNVFSFEYDNNGNRTKTIYPNGNSISAEYDARGRIVKEKDEYGYTTNYTYNNLDKLIKVEDPKGGIYEYDYNNVGELIAVYDALGNKTSYEYDGEGRVVRTILSNGLESTFTYDEVGNVVSAKDYKGVKTNYTYNDNNQLIKKVVDNKTTEYTYNLNDLIDTVKDESGVTTYKYNELGELIEKKLPSKIALKYEYDKSGRLTKAITPYGNTEYAYDALDRVTRVIAKNGEATVYEYDELGNRTTVKYANGITMSYEYDSLNRLIKEVTKDKNNNIIASYEYTLGKAGERLKVKELDCTTIYEYDELYRLTKETITKDNETSITIYAYDAVGNRTIKNENGVITKYEYNELNAITKETNPKYTIKYEYDKNGNQISQNGGEKNYIYVYNNENKLERVTISSGADVTVESYKYDYEGNRIEKTVNELETTKYVVDTNFALAQVIAELNKDNSLKTYYTIGQELISLEDKDGIGYYLYDGHGSVRALTNKDGDITDSYSFDAFGNLIEKEGSTENNYLYVGEQYDSNTGFYYLRARYMNPTTGTFISMDSYSGSTYDPVTLHKYLYANADPVNNTDPTGYFSLAEFSVSSSISSILSGIQSASVMQILNFINIALTAYDTIRTAVTAIQNGESLMSVCGAIVRGVFTGFLLNKLCAVKAISFILAPILAIFGAGNQVKSIFDAIENEDYDLATVRTVQLVIMFFSLTQSCFTADTLVETENGKVRIDEMEVGDYVYALNIETGEKELKKVVKVFENDTDTLVNVKINGEEINTTKDHPFYVEGKGWIAAGDLEIGDKLLTKDDVEIEVLDVIVEKLDEPIKVYNLEVEGNHNYFVSKGMVLVHNSCEPEGVGNPVESVGNGSTGRTTPNTLNEQMAMHEVQSNPLQGAIDMSLLPKKPVIMTDQRWSSSDGWVKMTNNVNGVEIHFVYNVITGGFDDFKFK